MKQRLGDSGSTVDYMGSRDGNITARFDVWQMFQVCAFSEQFRGYDMHLVDIVLVSVVLMKQIKIKQLRGDYSVSALVVALAVASVHAMKREISR
jgi:hypothetical protein